MNQKCIKVVSLSIMVSCLNCASLTLLYATHVTTTTATTTTTTTTLFFVNRSWIVCLANNWKASRGGTRQLHE